MNKPTFDLEERLITKPVLLESLIAEADELVRIFASSIRATQRNGGSPT